MFGLNFGRKADAAPEGEFLTARLNARLQPLDRGDIYEDPLETELAGMKVGKVTGGGTQLAGDPDGIEFCDLEINVLAADDETLATIVERLNALGAPKGSKLILGSANENGRREIAFGVSEGLALFLNGTDLPDNVYADCDVNHVIEALNQALGGKGKYQSHWQGAHETALYLYGASFAEMKTAIAEFVASYPLCEKSRIEQIA